MSASITGCVAVSCSVWLVGVSGPKGSRLYGLEFGVLVMRVEDLGCGVLGFVLTVSYTLQTCQHAVLQTVQVLEFSML